MGHDNRHVCFYKEKEKICIQPHKLDSVNNCKTNEKKTLQKKFRLIREAQE